MTIRVFELAGPFAEDKDVAKSIREQFLLPSIDSGQPITLDFENVLSSTQSFIHAMISKPLQHGGEVVLEKVTFAHCTKKVQELIVMVTNYSLE